MVADQRFRISVSSSTTNDASEAPQSSGDRANNMGENFFVYRWYEITQDNLLLVLLFKSKNLRKENWSLESQQEETISFQVPSRQIGMLGLSSNLSSVEAPLSESTKCRSR